MRKVFHILVVFSISGYLAGCAHQSPGLKVLEERADYAANDEDPELSIGSTSKVNDVGPCLVPTKTAVPLRPGSKVKVAWLHGHEMATGDWFWGSCISVVYDHERWEMKRIPFVNEVKRSNH